MNSPVRLNSTLSAQLVELAHLVSNLEGRTPASLQRGVERAEAMRAIREVRDQIDDLAGYDDLDWSIARPALRRLSRKLKLVMVVMARRHG